MHLIREGVERRRNRRLATDDEGARRRLDHVAVDLVATALGLEERAVVDSAELGKQRPFSLLSFVSFTSVACVTTPNDAPRVRMDTRWSRRACDVTTRLNLPPG